VTSFPLRHQSLAGTFRAAAGGWSRLGMALGAVTIFAGTATPVARAQDAKVVVDHVDRILRGQSSRGRMTMTIVTRQWSRSLDLAMWSLGTEYALVRVDAPAREAGTATLKVQNDVWNYLPRVDRTIKIPASLMQGAWMGSHFTNDDLVKESRLVKDYDIATSFDGVRGGARIWEFTLTPRPEAPVVWGKVLMEVRQADTLPIRSRYYDDAGRLSRTMTFDDYRRMGGRAVPARLTVLPADKPDEHTVVEYHDLEFDLGLEPDFFSLRNLRRSH
jgi:Outer membrane lipoprotein-sorting protein